MTVQIHTCISLEAVSFISFMVCSHVNYCLIYTDTEYLLYCIRYWFGIVALLRS